jgi:hypothetical protein
MAMKLLSLALCLVFACTAAAWANCIPGSPPSDLDVSLIRWTTACFVGGGPTAAVILQRIQRVDGTTAYSNQLRGTSGGVPLVGSYENSDSKLFDAALELVNATKAESIRLKARAYLDGCASFLAVTRCNATLTISEANMDYDDPEYKRFDRLLHDLSDLAFRSDWKKVGSRRFVYPLMFQSLDQPASH